MHELLEQILEDLHHMHSNGELEGPQLQSILDMIEKREYEYTEMQQGRETQLPEWIQRLNATLDESQ